MTRDKILDRTRKLQAMAESAGDIGNIAEAEAFAAKVAELVNEHNISKAELTPEEILDQTVIHVSVSAEDCGLKYGRQRCDWMERLMGMLARQNSCRPTVISGSNSQGVYGTKEDVEVVVMLFVFLAPMLNRMAEKAYNRFYWEMEKQGLRSQARGYRKSWLIGAVSGINEKMKEQQTYRNTSSGKALIRLTDQLVTDYGKRFTSAGGLSATSLNRAAHQDGRIEGKSINTQPIVG